MEELLAELEEHEKRLSGENSKRAEEDKDDETKSENPGCG